MFAILTRRKAAGIIARTEAATGALAAVRRKRVFDRTIMLPDVIAPVQATMPLGKPLWRDTFGTKPR
jgi:hypothetical protein